MTIYDLNNVKNTVVNGKVDEEEKKMLSKLLMILRQKNLLWIL